MISFRQTAVALGVLVTGGTLAQAAPITFNYVGACAFNCSDEGLQTGARATGRVVLDDAGFSPDGFFGNEALIDFSFDLGGIRLVRATSAAFDFGGPWEVIPGAGLAWYLNASTSRTRFDQLGPTISISGSADGGFGEGSFLGTCDANAEFTCPIAFQTAAQFELSPDMAPVPLPGTGLLLAASLLGLGVFGIRRAGGAVRGTT